MQIHFLGAADTVTGSKHLVEAAGQRVFARRAWRSWRTETGSSILKGRMGMGGS